MYRYSLLWWTGFGFIVLGIANLGHVSDRFSPAVPEATTIVGPNPNVLAIVG